MIWQQILEPKYNYQSFINFLYKFLSNHLIHKLYFVISDAD